MLLYYFKNPLSDELQQVQKRATKMLLAGLSYRDRLVHLRLDRRDEICRRFYKTTMRPEDRINDVLPPQELNLSTRYGTQ